MAGELIQKFETGANRSADTGKYDFEGFLSPAVLERFGEYMHKHRHLPDGSMRDSDNWQRGIPKKNYVKSLIRHTFEMWQLWRGQTVIDKQTGMVVNVEDQLCAIMFNSMGLLHETLKEKSNDPT